MEADGVMVQYAVLIFERETPGGVADLPPEAMRARADMLHRLGRDAEAVEAYKAALALTGNAAEQEFLAERLRSARQAH
jgi:predicted RNA polymerase sigma factor